MELKVFVQTNCRYCPQVVNYLESEGVEFTKINLSTDPQENKYDIMSTPCVVLVDEDEEVAKYAGTDTDELDVLIDQL